MQSTKPDTQNKRSKRPWWRVALKYTGLFVMACVLFIIGLVAISLSLLTPQRLTPIVNHVANTSLQNCNVDIARVQIGLRKTYPFFCLDVDSMVITSTVTAGLPDADRKRLPEYADTVAAIDHFHGGINVLQLMNGTLDFSDLVIDGPTANAVVIDSTLTNYDIFVPTEEVENEEPFDIATLPTIRAKKFAIVNPKPIRYYDGTTGTEAALMFDDVSLDANSAPLYKMRFNGDISTPLFSQYLNLSDILFGLNGDIEWSQSKPYAVAIKNFDFKVAPISGYIDTKADFTNGLRVDSLTLRVNPLKISDVLNLLPSDFGAPTDIKTDAAIKAELKLSEPFIASESALPHFTVDLEIPQTAFVWRDLNLDRMEAKARVTVPTDAFSDIRVDLYNLLLKGRATDLKLSGHATNLIDDPYFSGTVLGHCNLNRLPAAVRRLIPGSLSGRLRADATISGNMSMLTPQSFQKLQVEGKISANNLYWIGDDAASMLWANNPVIDFGTQRTATTANKSKMRLMSARLTVDTASIFYDVLDMHLKDFTVGLGAQNKNIVAGSREIVPMGGRIAIGEFKLTSITDSARLRVREAEGLASVRVHNGNLNQPEFGVKLTANRIIAGDRSTRFSISEAATTFNTWPEPQGRRAKQVALVYDSLRRKHPRMEQDSLIANAVRIYEAKRPRRNNHRVEVEQDSTEIIEWISDNSINKFLSGWHFEGSISSRRARLFTPYLPARNRVKELDVKFNNDTIDVSELSYNLGRTDLNIKGKVTNLRRALTSKTGRQPLRITLDMHSDTIDVNQLASIVFAGQAYAAANDSLKQTINLGDSDDEQSMEKAVLATSSTTQAATGPLLIPQNIDATLNFKADNIIYSDMLLNNFTGTVLASDGIVNINEMKAAGSFGAVNLSALYMGRTAKTLKFGMGLKVDRFNINRFLRLVPAIDSVMPVLRDFGGIINANIAATSNLTPQMDFDLGTMDAAVSLSGDSLVLLDPDTFKSLSKWLMFKNKKRNIIDHMSVQLLVRDNVMEMYPFIFNIDRYRLGVQGYNDFNMNFKYHIAVLKSPIPFKFGINIEGTPDKYKIRLGGAKFGEKTPVNVALVDSTRINLIREIRNVFRRNIRDGEFAGLNRGILKTGNKNMLVGDSTEAPIDSAQFIQHGLIEAPEPAPEPENTKKSKKKKGKK